MLLEIKIQVMLDLAKKKSCTYETVSNISNTDSVGCDFMSDLI